MNKYLYGKKVHLEPVVNGDAGFRFSDLTHYARLENENMRDEEMVKAFIVDKDTNEIHVNGLLLNSEDIAADPEFSFSARHCFCLCLSNRKNSPELFEKFKADICIEVKVDALIKFLNMVCSDIFPGMFVDARDIVYYSKGYLPEELSSIDLVFHKPKSFEHEDEFRMALFYPLDRPGFKSSEGDTIPFINEGESNHLTVSCENPEFLKQFIGELFIK